MFNITDDIFSFYYTQIWCKYLAFLTGILRDLTIIRKWVTFWATLYLWVSIIVGLLVSVYTVSSCDSTLQRHLENSVNFVAFFEQRVEI